MIHYEYFLILGIIATVATFLKRHFSITLFLNFKELLIYYGVVLVIGTLWDNYAIYKGHWSYPGNGTIGIFIGLAPIEDYFFAIICTYFVLVVYRILHK